MNDMILFMISIPFDSRETSCQASHVWTLSSVALLGQLSAIGHCVIDLIVKRLWPFCDIVGQAAMATWSRVWPFQRESIPAEARTPIVATEPTPSTLAIVATEPTPSTPAIVATEPTPSPVLASELIVADVGAGDLSDDWEVPDSDLETETESEDGENGAGYPLTLANDLQRTVAHPIVKAVVRFLLEVEIAVFSNEFWLLSIDSHFKLWTMDLMEAKRQNIIGARIRY